MGMPMKHKYFILLCFITIIILLFAIVWISFSLKPRTKTDKSENADCSGITGCLVVNHAEVKNAQVTVYPGEAELPFVQVLEHLGYQIEYIDCNNLVVEKDNRVFFLDLNKMNLTENGGEGMNLLSSPPGNSYFFRKQIKNDIVIDINTLNATMYLMGNSINFTIDYENACVRISTKA